MRKYALMLFETRLDLGLPDAKPNEWVNTNNIMFNDGAQALYAFANTPCPASQLVDGEDDYELQCKMGEMMLNYMNEEWLDEHLYPYL